MRIGVLVLFCFAAIVVGQNEGDLWAKYQEDLKANPRNSVTHFLIGEIHWQRGKYLEAGNSFREALNGNLDPKWIEVWAHLNLGKMYDMLEQRERAVNEYKRVKQLNDNTRGAVDEATLYLQFPYPKK